MKKKLEELQTTLPSPIPSPDINAPSPEPDNDFVLPSGNVSIFLFSFTLVWKKMIKFKSNYF